MNVLFLVFIFESIYVVKNICIYLKMLSIFIVICLCNIVILKLIDVLVF